MDQYFLIFLIGFRIKTICWFNIVCLLTGKLTKIILKKTHSFPFDKIRKALRAANKAKYFSTATKPIFIVIVKDRSES